jgi:3-deoxy-D-manno-octulosonate 8-phosphate phosphatase (KDO 8-P phosphatase)
MQERLARIRLLLLDVDGVMTDGRIIYDDRGGETKAFDVRDGHGLKMLQRAGIRVGIITGRQSPVVDRRASELGIELVYQGAKDKLLPFREILAKTGLTADAVAYVGDDLPDLPVLRRVGFAATVADAMAELKPHVHYITRAPGGRGAVREICDLLLQAGGHWESLTDRYFAESL